MSTLNDFEAALPALNAHELTCVERAARRLRRERGGAGVKDDRDYFSDGRPWPESEVELRALLEEMDVTPPLEMTEQEIQEWEARCQAERERQKRAFPQWGQEVNGLFP